MLLKERVQRELAVDDEVKTAEMMRLEHKHGRPILDLIMPRPGIRAADIAEELGIDEGTLSKWRKRLGFQKVRRVKPGPKSKRGNSQN